MSIPVIGDGFGQTYTKPVPQRVPEGRNETIVETVVGGRMVTMIVRQDVAVEDPYQNLARAAAYAIVTGEAFPAPPVARDIKDHLIRTNVVI